MFRKLFAPASLFLLLGLPGLVGGLSANAQAPSSSADNVASIRINEVVFYPPVGSHEWVELRNYGVTPAPMAGYRLSDLDGNWYRVPYTLPDVPSGAYVVAVFDGLGADADDYDFSDNVARLHSPPGVVDIFEDDADQCALYGRTTYLPLVSKARFGSTSSQTDPTRPWPGGGINGAGNGDRASSADQRTDAKTAESLPVGEQSEAGTAGGILGFVAWGRDAGEDGDEAAAAGLWGEGMYVSLSTGLGIESPETAASLGESIGLLPDSQTGYPDDWTLYQVNEVTQGSDNSSPAISWYYPAAGATVEGATFAISWNMIKGATSYRFQMDNNSDFSSPETDLSLAEPSYLPSTPVAEGTYYWRVKVVFATGESAWTRVSLSRPWTSLGLA